MSQTSQNSRNEMIELLRRHNVSIDYVDKGGWVRCGGRMVDTIRKSDMELFRSYFGKDQDLPDFIDECSCGKTGLARNIYICQNRDISTLIIVGSTCATKFDKDIMKKRCDKCGAIHKNRSVNRCNVCRKGHCDKCYRVIGVYMGKKLTCPCEYDIMA